jgi:hypothetical protein
VRGESARENRGLRRFARNESAGACGHKSEKSLPNDTSKLCQKNQNLAHLARKAFGRLAARGRRVPQMRLGRTPPRRTERRSISRKSRRSAQRRTRIVPQVVGLGALFAWSTRRKTARGAKCASCTSASRDSAAGPRREKARLFAKLGSSHHYSHVFILLINNEVVILLQRSRKPVGACPSAPPLSRAPRAGRQSLRMAARVVAPAPPAAALGIDVDIADAAPVQRAAEAAVRGA